MTNIPLPLLIVAYGALGLAGSLFFWRGRDAALKRRLWPAYILAAFALFVLILYAQMASPPPVFLGAVVVIMLLNLWSMKFCDACGAMVPRRNPLAAPKVCPRCGAALDRPR